MSIENQNVPIPPEREAVFLANAESAVNYAAEPVIKELGGLVIGAAEDAQADYNLGGPVGQAEALIEEDAQAATMVREATAFARTHDLSQMFIEEVTRPIPGVADEAERVLAEYNAMKAQFANSTPYTPGLQQPSGQAISESNSNHKEAVNLGANSFIDSVDELQQESSRPDNKRRLINEAENDSALGYKWRRPRNPVE